jgi:hypothetical protein
MLVSNVSMFSVLVWGFRIQEEIHLSAWGFSYNTHELGPILECTLNLYNSFPKIMVSYF